MIRMSLAAGLVAAPVLFTATEYTRLSVEHGTNDPASGLNAIAEARSTWELLGWLVLTTAPLWLLATLGLIEGLRERRERWAAVGGGIGLLGALGWTMHQAAYVEVNALAAAQLDEHRAVALEVYDGVGGTGMEDATIFVMAAGLLLGVLLLLLGHARAGTIPWWAFACAPVWVIVTVMASGAPPVLALGNLALLPPFALIARRLVRPESVVTSRREYAVSA